MKTENQRKLDDVISEELDALRDLKPGSKEHLLAVKDLKELYQLTLEEQKIRNAELDSIDKKSVDEAEIRVKELEIQDKKRERWMTAALQVGLTAVGWVIYTAWMREGFEFEKENTVRSPWIRNVINRMTPKR